MYFMFPRLIFEYLKNCLTLFNRYVNNKMLYTYFDLTRKSRFECFNIFEAWEIGSRVETRQSMGRISQLRAFTAPNFPLDHFPKPLYQALWICVFYHVLSEIQTIHVAQVLKKQM